MSQTSQVARRDPESELLDGRTRRVVKYRRGVDVWEYVSGMRRLPGPYLFRDDPNYPRP